MPPKIGKLFPNILLALLLISLLVGCNLPEPLNKPGNNPQTTPKSEIPETMLTFRVTLPASIPAGDSLYITLLDEVTGLAFNAHRYTLQAEDALHYSTSLPFYLGKVIKYRYSRAGASTVDEHLYNDRPVRYRMVHVEGPGTVNDVVSGWTDSVYTGPTGRIMGRVSDHTSGAPVPNILVAAGGEQTLTLADGTFLLEGLPPGTHNMVFYSLDGAYHIYQQGAVVAADSTTPVAIELTPARLVTVIFTAKVPADTPLDAPIRLAGSLSQLGNTFADLLGGTSSLPTRMPVLGKLSDGRYMVTLYLPAGAYIEYKYTLGDGLWSSEVTTEGAFRLRQLIVPDSDLNVEDSMDAWSLAGSTPIRFEVKVPANTPANESIFIQLNPGFDWLEPLPMWSATDDQGEAVWRFDLTGPFNNLPSLHYRYCRQGQCGSADDAATVGVNPAGREVNPSARPGTVRDEVLSWRWYSGPFAPPSVPDIQVLPRGTEFITGVSLQPSYHPSWGPLLPQAVQDIKNLGVNWLILSPTWTFTNNTPPILETDPQQDMLWSDLVSIIGTAQKANLSVGIFPAPHFLSAVDQWWMTAARDYPWWVSFFERYSNFILHHATAAGQTNANTLILGGNWLNPAMPGGVLSDGTPSNVPQDAEQRYRDLIARVRQRFHGNIAWALAYPDGVRNPPPFLDAVDQVYILWSAPLAIQPGVHMEEMQVEAASVLDQEILPFQQRLGKPIIIALSYPSIDRGATGCIAVLGGGCLDYSILNPPNTDITELSLDFQVQADAYNAVLTAINDHQWIAGYVSMGYYPPAILQDKSTSVHGKPASGVLWYWSQKFLGR